MSSPPTPPRTHQLSHLATLTPPSNSRTWQSAPHPSLPIVATACSDRSVRVYSLTSFTLLHSITGGHKRSVRTVSWKPGTRGQSVLATGSFDSSAGIWRREEQGGALEDDFTKRRVGGGANDSDDDDARDDEADDYQFSCILDGHESEIKCLAWSPSGQYLATCSRDKSVWIWEELEDDNFETVAVLQEHDGDVKSVAWHPEEDLLVSTSYDDTVRLYREDSDDWVQVSLIDGHDKTVWWAEFEGSGMRTKDWRKDTAGLSAEQAQYVEGLDRSGPRLTTCSDDCTVRIWRRQAKDAGETASGNAGMPSIIRSAAIDEDWYQEAVLPRVHERAIYSVSWSRSTGLIVSAGSDGKIIVYEERWRRQDEGGVDGEEMGVDGMQTESQSQSQSQSQAQTEWVVVAELFSGHDVFEINHVCWARRADKGKREEGEEVVLSTGDDGEVRVWTLDGVDE